MIATHAQGYDEWNDKRHNRWTDENQKSGENTTLDDKKNSYTERRDLK